ncbi:MAG: 4Fe-4S binding protein [Candidatus Nanopelagicales bacterium]|nr:4Fe-4S binding protein [Candidatus Nanopelagicales bacterium]MCF8539611.1 4Fe-4S binding protein [Candidatus Nanopelagicales bacterium]
MTHSFIALIPEKCTSCMLCVRECPAWCIHLDSHTVEVSEPGARRPKKVNVLDSFDIDYSLCMYCGICVDVCPFDALEWDQHRALVGPTRDALYLTKEQLSTEQ